MPGTTEDGQPRFCSITIRVAVTLEVMEELLPRKSVRADVGCLRQNGARVWSPLGKLQAGPPWKEVHPRLSAHPFCFPTHPLLISILGLLPVAPAC